jgi:uroporphyrinogen III methyltransferase / synthase
VTGAGRVFIIGAGPGDPGLISARGVRLLAEADVVVYDQATEAVLRWTRPDAEKIAAGAPAERETAQDAISMLVAEKARDGHTVARLKWGDPYVFDSGAKEALFLHEQGVPFEVVPGIPAAIGASAYAGVPITYPGSGDALLFLRGHEGDTDPAPDVDWSAVARLDGTLVCYAGGRQAPAILQALIDHGRPADEPAALIYSGTHPTQRTVTGTLGDLLQMIVGTAQPETAMLVVGEVTGLRDHLRWFDERPLFGRRIVVTRSREQALELVEELENQGAQAIEAPTFRLAPPEDPEAVDRAAASVDHHRWVVFESASAVTRFMSALSRGPRDLRALGGVSICVIGPSTAERLVAHGIKPDVVLPEFRLDAIVEAMTARAPLSGQRVLVVRPDHLRDVLADEFSRRGAIVTDLIAYRIAPESPDSPVAQDIYRMLLDNQVDAVTFTSPTAVELFVQFVGQEQAVDLLNTTVVAAIGPVTAAAAEGLGIRVSLVPDTYTVKGLVRALVAHFSAHH